MLAYNLIIYVNRKHIYADNIIVSSYNGIIAIKPL
jgi:hypothetical protein